MRMRVKRVGRVQQSQREQVAAMLALLLLAGAPAFADDASEAAEAEKLATEVYFEGVVYDDARAVTAVGARHLVSLLGEVSSARHHGDVLLVIGIAAHPGAFEALSAYASGLSSAEGEVSAAEYRALRMLPLAMGHLANQDPRAVAWLAARARASAVAPAWSRGAMHGTRLAGAQRRAAINGLGLAGNPAATQVLREVAGLTPAPREGASRAAASDELAGQAREALELAENLQRMGRSSVFAGEGAAR